LLIFILCFLPGKDLPEVNLPFVDKWTHLILFAVFSFLWLTSSNTVSIKVFIIVFFASGYTGWIIEYIQGHFVPDRSQDNMDTLADIAGSVGGMIVFATLFFFKKSVSS
jgi:VanZ family protein